MDSTTPGPFTATDSEAHSDPSTSSGSSPPLSPQHRDQLRASGLTDETIDALGWWSASEAEVRTLLSYAENAPCGGGLVIRYPASDILRVRLDQPRRYVNEGKEREQRYATPRGGESGLYIPRRTSELLAADTRVALYITEGEKKAEALAQEGFAAVGLPGISMWSDSRAREESWDRGDDERPLLIELEKLIKTDQVVVIVYDSPDMQGLREKDDALREAVLLSKAILEQKALPMLCLLPWDDYVNAFHESDEPEKLGADDLLKAWGSRRFRTAIEDLTPAEPAKLLAMFSRGERVNSNGSITIDPELVGRPDQQTLAWILNWAGHWMGPGKGYMSWLRRAVKNKWLTEDHAEEILERAREKSGATAEHWVARWLARKGAKYRYADQAVTIHGIARDANVLGAGMRLARDKQGAPWSDRALDDAWLLWADEQDRATRAAISRTITWHPGPNRVEGINDRPPGERMLRRWLQAVTGRVDPLDLAALRHFIWQVKRKLADKQVEHHLLVVVFGKSGGGKSVAVERLVSPLGELVGQMEVATLTDTRESFRLTRFPVMVLDEMAKAERADVETLKNRISAGWVQYRVLGTNKLVSGQQLATFIGTSNREISQIIIDPTSARRYWQLNALDQLDWAAINDINYVEMWQSVDVAEPCPLRPALTEIRKRQNAELRAKSLLEQWCEEAVEPTSLEHGTTPTALWEAYKSWLDDLGIRTKPTQKRFGMEMHELGLEAKKLNGKWRYPLRLLPNGIAERSAEVFEAVRESLKKPK